MTTINNTIKLTEKELKALTWKEDVDGLIVILDGMEAVICYEVDPSYEVMRISVEDLAAIVSDRNGFTLMTQPKLQAEDEQITYTAYIADDNGTTERVTVETDDNGDYIEKNGTRYYCDPVTNLAINYLS